MQLLNVKVDRKQTNKSKEGVFSRVGLRANGLFCFAAIDNGDMLACDQVTAILSCVNLTYADRHHRARLVVVKRVIAYDENSKVYV